MAHYSFLDENNIVTKVIVGNDESNTDNLPNQFNNWEEFYSDKFNLTCKRTSYNTRNNEHTSGGIAFRGNFAGIGYTYDQDNDVFIAKQPYDSWTLNTNNWKWEAPIDYPNDGGAYSWDEENQTWV